MSLIGRKIRLAEGGIEYTVIDKITCIDDENDNVPITGYLITYDDMTVIDIKHYEIFDLVPRPKFIHPGLSLPEETTNKLCFATFSNEIKDIG